MRRARQHRARYLPSGKDTQIVTKLVNSCWSLFKHGLMVVLVVAIGLAIYLYTHMDDEIRRRAETALAEQFPQMDVSIGGARIVEGEGIVVYDLTLNETMGGAESSRLLHIEELQLECDASLSRLVKGVPDVRRVVIRRPQLRIDRAPDGRLNLQALLPLPKPSASRPAIVIQGASLTYRDRTTPDLPPLAVREINVTISNAAANTPSSGKDAVHLAGTLAGSQWRGASFKAAIDLSQGDYQGEIALDQLHLDDDLQVWITQFSSPAMREAKLDCRMGGTVRVAGNWRSQKPPEITASMNMSHGRLHHPRLPRPLTEMHCRLTLDGRRLAIHDLQAKCGSASVAASYSRNGLQPQAPAALAARVLNLPLDLKLRSALPDQLQVEWDKYKPEGIVDGTIQATFDGQRWTPLADSAQLVGRDLSFESDKFPYRMNKGYGKITALPPSQGQPLRLVIDMVGHGGGQPLHIAGQVFDPKPGAPGYVTITGKNVEIEKRMIAALAPKPRAVITSLRPNGNFDFQWRIDRKHQGAKPHTTLALDLVDLSVNYEKFPYPLSKISGQVIAEDNRWWFKNLRSNGRREIQCAGTLMPAPTGSHLALRFTSNQVPLDDNLFEALDKNVQHAWTELRPRGHVGFSADVNYRSGQGKPSIQAEIRPLPETASLQPKFFNYLMDKVSGTISYDEGKVILSEVRASHGRTTVRTNGEGYFAPNGQWQMKLVGLTVDKLSPRGDLLTALPVKLSKLIDSLRPTGTFRLDNGVLDFRKAGSAVAAVEAEWDVQLTCQQTDLQVGIDLHNIHGTVRLVGASDRQRSYSSGELDLDSVTFEDVQFTKVRGPFWADESQCRLGRRASVHTRQTPRPLTARAYDGAVTADASVTFHGLPRYSAVANLEGVDLARMVTERFGSAENFSGKIDANVKIGGTGRSLHALVGEGDVHIRDADIYESPVLLRVLKTLRYGKVDKTAFNEANIRFRMDGQHIHLDQLDFLGDVVTLYGQGYTNFNQDLKLVFDGVVGRNDYQLPFVKNLVRSTNQQILQMYVEGTLSDPIVQKQAFPGVNRFLEQFQSRPDIPLPTGPPRANIPRTAQPGSRQQR